MNNVELNFPLCVNLEGALIYCNLFQEAITLFIKKNPFYLFVILYWFIKGGKPYLKEKLVANITLAPEALPYNKELLDWISSEKEKSRKIVLVSTSEKKFVDTIVNHLGIFDDVIISNKHSLYNSKNEAYLNKIYGEKKYDYVGGSRHDIHVWNSANRAIIVNNKKNFPELGATVATSVKVFSGKTFSLKELFIALRVYQYTKNILIFVPIITAHLVFDLYIWGKVCFAFLCFCCIASSIYLINDIVDLQEDRKHFIKKNRSIASGALSILNGVLLAVLLFCFAFAGALFLSLKFTAILFIYFVLAILYSFIFKNILLIDIIVLAILYTIRIIAGLVLLNSSLFSTWLLLFSLFFFMSLAFLKRVSALFYSKDSLTNYSRKSQYTGAHYNILTIFGISSGLLSILIFALYLISSDAMILYQYPKLLLLIFPILTYWLMRIWLISIEGGVVDDPVLFAIKDKPTYYCVVLILVIMFFASI